MRSLFGLMAAWLAGIAIVTADEMVFPPDAFIAGHFVDVTAFGASTNGVTDATTAIQAAIHSLETTDSPRQKTLYFPTGTYLISGTLDTVGATSTNIYRFTFLGQSRTGTVIKLAPGASGFTDAAHPKPMIKTESITGQTPFDGFENAVRNLTVDAGSGNPGAVGIDFLGNNCAGIRDVTVRTSSSGYAGIAMTRAYPGPCLVKDVEVDGFQYGLTAGQVEYGITLEDLTLVGQSTAGISNTGNALFIRNLVSTNTVTAINNNSGPGLLVVTDSSMTGGSSIYPAVKNVGGAFVRDTVTSGYGQSVKNSSTTGTGIDAPTGSVAEYSSHAVLTPGLPGSRTSSLRLPVRETPVFSDNDFADWYSVGDQTAPDPSPVADQTAAIQAAIDAAAAAGKTTLYFPPGKYYVFGQIHLYGSIRRVLGLGSYLMPIAKVATDPYGSNHAASPLAVIRVGDPGGGAQDLSGTLEIDRLSISPSHIYTSSVYCNAIQHDSRHALVLNDATYTATDAYHGIDGGGDLYVENVCGSSWFFDHPGQRIWARQFNPEGSTTKVTTVGSTLWVLGMKTEHPGTLIDASGGALTEIVGGFFYPVTAFGTGPMLKVADSQLSASYVTMTGSGTPDFTNQIVETRGGATATLTNTNTYARVLTSTTASMAPLAVAAPASTEAVLDTDVAGQVTLTGSWNPSATLSGYHGTNYFTDEATGKGSKSALFSPVPKVPGDYNVYLTWTATGNRPVNVPVTVNDDDGASSYVVDQTQRGSHFVLLGTHPFWTGSASSLLMENSGTAALTYVIADAARFVLASQDALATTTDDADPSTQFGGAWSWSAYDDTAWRGGYQSDGGTNKGSCTAAFYPAVAQAATYDVYLRWPTAANQAAAVPVTVRHGTSTASLTVNESVNGGQWVYLGSYAFNPANAGADNVTISNAGTPAGKLVTADAVCLVRVQAP